MVTVHIVDDHRMLVEGLTLSINESKIARVIGVSHSLAECRKTLMNQQPDVLLLDLNLPDGNGVDFCVEAKKAYRDLKILVLTTHNEYSVAKRVMNNGASGYILKNALSEEVIAGITAVMNGETFLCDEIEIIMRKRIDQPVWLTMREQQLLKLITLGYTNQEIANEMFLGVETIKSYRKNLLLKLGAKNSMILVRMAIEEKLI